MCFFNIFELKSITKQGWGGGGGGGGWGVGWLCSNSGLVLVKQRPSVGKWSLREASVEKVFWVAPCLQMHLQIFNDSVIDGFVRRGSQHPRAFSFNDASKHRSRVGRAIVKVLKQLVTLNIGLISSMASVAYRLLL